MLQDSRRYHRQHPPTFARAYGSQSSTPGVISPFGGLPTTIAGRINRQQLSPLLLGLGIGQGKKYDKLMADIASGKASGPMASAIQQIQQFVPGVVGGATDIGKQIAQMGGPAYEQLKSSIATAQAQMPQYQQGINQAFSADQAALQQAQNLYGQAAAQLPGLQQTAAQGTQGAQTALDLAQRYAQQAASPIANEDLYQMASRRALQQLQPGLAARGMEAGGAGAQAQADVQRDLAYQFAANQAQQRQATLQGLQGAAAGAQQAAAGQAALGQTMIPYLQAIQQGGGQLGSAAQQGAQMLMTGPELAGQQFNAMNQYGNALMQQYNLPMQASGNLLNLLTAGMGPGIQLTQATAPQVASSSKGYNII